MQHLNANPPLPEQCIPSPAREPM